MGRDQLSGGPEFDRDDRGGLPGRILGKLEQWLAPEQMAELQRMASGGDYEDDYEPDYDDTYDEERDCPPGGGPDPYEGEKRRRHAMDAAVTRSIARRFPGYGRLKDANSMYGR